ncbi:hypothetical protein POM88_044360 [Heracleum sosnowskyi]|uniref:Uncharacterized protein n=1 Tax=Heracleum sosnowskyi TaxID=360622 RepID=A0AAD8H3U3_9APIA|nr:hypothetical protein POM88_044360 [Heracleum sosnowskyi]
MAAASIIPDLNEDPNIFDSTLPDLNEDPSIYHFIIPDLNEDPTIFDIDASLDTSNHASFISTAKGRKRLTNLEKKQICHVLSLNYNDNKLNKGTINKIASDYAVSRMTISKIRKKVLQSIKVGEQPNVQRKYTGGNKGYVLDLQQGIQLSNQLALHICKCSNQQQTQQQGSRRYNTRNSLVMPSSETADQKYFPAEQSVASYAPIKL